MADPSKRRGTLLLQPGGPGNSGVDFVHDNYADLPEQLREGFDVLGFDARGVARSSQLECWSDQRYLEAVTAAKGRPRDGAVEQALQSAAAFDAACEQQAGDLLSYIGTEYVARDVELLRQAVDEERLTFYGRSFGTWIGTVYANLFPERVRAMVLDGAYDPATYAETPHASDRAQYQALDQSMGRFLDWCAADPALCGFGDGSPRRSFDKLVRDLDEKPVATSGGGSANGYTLAYRLMFNLNAGRELWPALGKALHQAEQRDNSSFLLKPPSAASFDFLTANVAVECVDRDYPGDLDRVRGELVGNTEAAPLLGPAIGLGPPLYDHNHPPACAQWLAEQVSGYDGPYRAEGAAPILVMGTTGDPDTPYQDAVALAGTLDSASLLTFEAEGHTAFGRSTCATDAVTAYLTDLTLPPPGTVCSDEAPPKPLPAVKKPERLDSDFFNGVELGKDLIRTPR
ncbi:MAG: alpha/beta hydrolase [Thermocrispum sp.]